MRIAVIADIHGNLEALQTVLDDIAQEKLDRVFCVGDLVGYGPFPNEVIDTIRAHRISTLQGNYDEGVGHDLMACGCDYKDEKALEIGARSLLWAQEHVTAENKAFLRELPTRVFEQFGGWRVQFVHGSPRANNEYLFEENLALDDIVSDMAEDVLVCGHTHVPYYKRVHGKHVINAGSAGKPKHGTPDASYVVIKFGDTDVRTEICFVPYDVERTAQALEVRGIPVEFAKMLRTG